MKKVTAAVLIFAIMFLFCSCNEQPEKVFDYQKELSSIEGTFKEGDRSYGIRLWFTENESGEKYCRRVEFSSPPAIAGMSFTLEGESITAELDGVRIADTLFDREAVFRAEKLFSLCEEDISSIRVKKNGAVEIEGENESAVFTVITDKSGAPRRITYECADGRMEFVVDKMEGLTKKAQ